ncbi:MAG: glycosyltransferase family 4 protein [Acidobacteriota bacterium]
MNELSRPRRIGYILKMFPRLSETFVLNEILELERQAADVRIFSLMHPADGRFHAGVADLRTGIRYVTTQKLEATWSDIGRSSTGVNYEAWPRVVEFARRYDFPRQLEFLLRAQSIAQQVIESNVEHLHAHFATIATRMAAAVSMLTAVPFSFTAHAKDIFRESVDRELFSELVDRSLFCVTVSDFNKEFILATMPGINPEKVVRVYNGVDLNRLTRSHREDASVPHVISVGRLVPKKGFDILLRALRLCKDRGRVLRTTIVGDGGENDRLRDLSRELGLERDVTFAGALSHEDTIERMGRASVVALACTRDDDGNTDALPTVLLEALALGLPIVSTRLAGIPEIVGEECGRLSDPGDVAGFAAGLESTCRDLERGRDVAAEARKRCERRFSLQINAGALLQRFTS